MASRAMTPTGEGRVCTSTTSALSPCPRVTWLVGLASVMARAGNARARASAGARTIVFVMGGLLVVVRQRSDQHSRPATGRPWFGALGRSSREQARHVMVRACETAPWRARAHLPHRCGVAAALALGPAVSNGIGRFAYALVLPAMRSDLHWTYTEAGWVNTANALGYLAGSLATLRLLRRLRPHGLFSVAMVVTSAAVFASGVSRNYPA